MVYTVRSITIEEKEEIASRYTPLVKFEHKSDIYGCCIKLLTDARIVKDRWEENFFAMSQNIRSHGRLYVLDDPRESKDTVLYDAQSKTAFLLNITYYGWIKSLALSVAGDILEDEHSIFSIHGACIDTGCGGLCIVGASGAGKTTHTYGMLRDERVHVIADDWFFVREFGKDVLAYGSEKNFYIRADLATIWPEFEDLVEHAEFDGEGRAVVDLRWVVGKGRILPLTRLRTMILLERRGDPVRCRQLEPSEALHHLESHTYFNPHLLIRNPFKEALRKSFFLKLLSHIDVYLVNTSGTPAETQQLVRGIAGLCA
ncbi:MAG: aldolase [Methanomicrobiales archaeon]|nr:aldolase [Methanomicrobiales archaeon]